MQAINQKFFSNHSKIENCQLSIINCPLIKVGWGRIGAMLAKKYLVEIRMLSINSYAIAYPTLAKFSQEADSPTYVRRSKSGKMVVVRKGRRKKGGMSNLAKGALIAGGAGAMIVLAMNAKGIISGANLKGLRRKIGSNKNVGKDLYRKEQGLLKKMQSSVKRTNSPKSNIKSQKDLDNLMQSNNSLLL